MEPVSVFDVAKYIIAAKGSLSAMKLQKLVYYCQAWSLVWDESPLFNERIEAWISGPVVPALFSEHKGKYMVTAADISQGDPSKLSPDQEETVKKVLDFYGGKNSQWLSDLTHMEDPWKIARKGLADNERGNSEITNDSMQEYYSSLAQ
jgi:uncharacterized phage-associated protein